MLSSKSNRIAIYISAFFIVVLITFAFFRDTAKLITLDEFHQHLKNKQVTKVVISNDYIFLKEVGAIYKVPRFEVAPKILQHFEVEIKNDNTLILYLFVFLLFSIVSFLAFRWLKEKNGSFLTSSTIKGSQDTDLQQQPIVPIRSDVSFDDIGGISDVKVELEEIIDFIKNPQKYKKHGVFMPRGVLLVGPPGVGKTMIAKAVAHEAGVPFFYQSGASFVQIYVGMGAKRVHELFSKAKKDTPSIIFIDEIDAVGKKRDGQRNDEREATLNQLLTEMDGFEGSSGIIVIAATNKIDVLDSALLRAGRFDRRIFVQLPTNEERESILQKYLQKVPHKLEVKKVANMCIGFSGASLAALVNEAALLSLREGSEYVLLEHFDSVKDKVMFGKKKLQILSEEQKKYRITYQSAKVICATYFDLPFEKLMLSNTKLMPSTDEPLIEYEIRSRVQMLLAGMVACDIYYKQHTSNVKDDLDEAKELIVQMLQEFGMGNSLFTNNHEEEKLFKELYKETKQLLKRFEKVIMEVESILNKKESITKIEVKDLLDEIL